MKFEIKSNCTEKVQSDINKLLKRVMIYYRVSGWSFDNATNILDIDCIMTLEDQEDNEKKRIY